MKNPCTTLVSAVSVVPTLSGPGNKQLTRPAAAIPASICVMKSKTPRTQSTAPMKTRPTVTAGLKRPPLIRKNVHALTARLKPEDDVLVHRGYTSAWLDNLTKA